MTTAPFRIRLAFAAVALLSLTCVGCAPRRSAEIDPTSIPTVDDIIKIVQFYPQDPWLFESERVIGFKTTAYFVSGQTEKGCFVPGTIFIWVYEVSSAKAGGRERKLAHVWEFDQAEALGFRVIKRSVMGYSYGFPLRWPADVPLEGKMVEIQIGYERNDKRVVLGAARRFRVPWPLGYEPAPAEAAP